MSEEIEKPKLNTKRILITTAIILAASLVVGGTTWYVMDKSAKEIETANDKSVVALQKEISVINTKLGTTQEKITQNDAKTSEIANTDYFTSLKTFCTADNPSMVIGGVEIIQTTDGIWGKCGIHVNGEGGGALVFYKYVNNVWQKMYTGNGLAQKSVCDTYIVPRDFWFCEQ